MSEPLKWKQRDGSMIPVRDMTCSHLINALAMCLRNQNKPELSPEKREVCRVWSERLCRELRSRSRDEYESHSFPAEDDDNIPITGVDIYGSLQ